MASMVGNVTTRSPRAPGRIIKMLCIEDLIFEQVVWGLESMVLQLKYFSSKILWFICFAKCFAKECDVNYTPSFFFLINSVT